MFPNPLVSVPPLPSFGLRTHVLAPCSDYVDELVINLRHNIQLNLSPRVDKTLGPRPPTAAPGEGSAAVCDRGALNELRGGGGGGGGKEVAVLRRLSHSRARACRLDWTDYEHEGTRNRRRCREHDDDDNEDNDDDDDARRGGDRMMAMRDWWWDDAGIVQRR